jgi:hypothetical protein
LLAKIWNMQIARNAQLRRPGASVEKVGYGGDKLGRRERLGHHDAVGDALGGPFRGAAPPLM